MASPKPGSLQENNGWYRSGPTNQWCPGWIHPPVLNWTCGCIWQDHWSWSWLDTHWILNSRWDDVSWFSLRLFDHSMEGFKNWEFMTIHCWGERAAGDWILEVYDTPSQLRNFKTPGEHFLSVVWLAVWKTRVSFSQGVFHTPMLTSVFLMLSCVLSCFHISSSQDDFRGSRSKIRKKEWIFR